MRALFLTWDGPQQSYLESLFLPIFAGLRARDVEVRVLQVTWASESLLEPVRRAAISLGIPYQSRRVPERLRTAALPALIGYGALAARAALEREGADVLFPRSLIPMSMALLLDQLPRSWPLVFDADGFMADERLDFGGWKASALPYRLLRRVEAAGVRRARAVICRTEKAREILIERAGLGPSQHVAKIFVAPNAKDPQHFPKRTGEERAVIRGEHGVPVEVPWVVYVGSLGPQYCPELMLDCFASIRRRRPDARFSCYTYHRALLEPLLRARNLEAAVDVGSLAPAEVPSVLAAADLGIALRRESPSQRGICPIKVPEYLLAGVPLVTTRVGDLEAQLGGSRAALLVDSTASGAADSVASWFVEQVLPARGAVREEARALGLRWFALDRCIDTYARAFLHRTSGGA